MILAHSEIIKALKAKKISVTPLDYDNIGPCSIDLCLGNQFKVMKKKGQFINVTNGFVCVEDVFYEKKIVREGGFIELKPFELVLGTTLERIKLSKGFAGSLEGRSRFARIGLMVHISSSFVQPGVNNVQVLEIINFSQNVIRLYPGVKICQIIFSKVQGEGVYSGVFKNQISP